MQNFSNLHGPGEEEVPVDTDDYGALIGTYFSHLDTKQPKGLSCQEVYKIPKFGPGIPDDSSEIDYSPPSTTRSQTYQSSNPVNSNSANNFNPLQGDDRREEDELIENFEEVAEPIPRNDYVEAQKMEEEDELNLAMNNDNIDAMVIEKGSPRIINEEEELKEVEYNAEVNSSNLQSQNREEEGKEETDNDNENEGEREGGGRRPKRKKSSEMKSLTGKFLVVVKRAVKYYWTRKSTQKKYELKSIEHVAQYIDQGTLKEFHDFISKVTSEEKTYEKCREFFNKNANAKMMELLRKVTICIFFGDPAKNFENENDKWLEKSITTKKEQFSRKLEKFAVIFSLGLGIHISKIPRELHIHSIDFDPSKHIMY